MNRMMPDIWPWTIAGGCVLIAIGAVVKMVEATSTANKLNEDVKTLRANVAKLEIANKEQAEQIARCVNNSDKEPLRYKQNYIA